MTTVGRWWPGLNFLPQFCDLHHTLCTQPTRIPQRSTPPEISWSQAYLRSASRYPNHCWCCLRTDCHLGRWHRSHHQKSMGEKKLHTLGSGSQRGRFPWHPNSKRAHLGVPQYKSISIPLADIFRGSHVKLPRKCSLEQIPVIKCLIHSWWVLLRKTASKPKISTTIKKKTAISSLCIFTSY